MKIYIDESKRLGKGQIIIGGFFTLHNNIYIDKFIEKKKKEFNIIKKIELKSINKYGKKFTEKISLDKEFENIEIYSFGFKFENYFIESSTGYMNLLISVLIKVLCSIIPNKGDKVNIFHDNINAKSNSIVEKKIDKILNEKLGIKASFKIHNSKKYLGLQLADLIVGKYKEYYLFKDINELDIFIKNNNYLNKKT